MTDVNIIEKNGMKIQKVIRYLLYLFLFLLPWQTRWIYKIGEIGGGVWEYGTLSFYGTEILLWTVILIFAFWKFGNKEFWKEFHQKIKKPSKNSKLFLLVYFVSLVLFGLILFFSLSFDISLQWGVWWLGSLCLGVVIVLYCHPERSEGSKEQILRSAQNDKTQSFIIALWLGGVLQGLLAFVQFFMQWTPANKWLGWAYHSGIDGGASVIEFTGGRFLRAYGSFGWPNSLGIYLGVCLIIGLIIYLKTKNSRLKIFITIGQLFVLSGLILSFSRSAWLAGVIGVLVLLIFNFKDIVRQVLYYSLLVTIYLLILFPLFSARLNLENRLESRSVDERISQYQEFSSILNQEDTKYEILNTRYLFGVGPGNYTLALEEIYPERNSWGYQPVHNIYLLSLAELGIFGFLIYWGLVLFLLRQVWKNNKVFLAPILALLIAGLFDHWLFSMYTGVVFFWVVFALSFRPKQSGVECSGGIA